MWRLNTFASLAIFTLMLAPARGSGVEPVDSVNPRLGCRPNRGSTVIGPCLPHGSVHPSPDSPDGAHAGYHMGNPIRGFSQLHVSGTGWGRYGNILVSPQIGLALAPDGHDSAQADEVATPYDYRARLTRYDILTELAPTKNAVFYRLTYPASNDANLLIDLAQQIPGQIATMITDVSVSESVVTLDPQRRTVSGSSRYEGGFGKGNYTVYFHAEHDMQASSSGTWKNLTPAQDTLTEKWSSAGDRIGAWWRFSTYAGQVVQMKIGISFHSVEKARDNLHREIPGWDLQSVRDAGRAAWSEALGSILVSGGGEAQRAQFYTALYHAQLMPRDRTGEFARFDPNVPMWDDQYAVWDTWRTKFPLMLLIQPEMVRGNIASFVERLRVDGQVRDTFSAGWGRKPCEWDQGGNNVDNVIADAYVKGLHGVDWRKAYEVLAFNAEHERAGNVSATKDEYRRQGWITAGTMSVSNSLEYAYNDFVSAQVALGLGKQANAARYLARSRQWQHLLNLKTESDGFKGFLMPRTQDGDWPGVDVKKYPGSWGLYFYESNAWTYSFFVPHQTARLVTLMGGRERFAERLRHANEADLIQFDNEPGFLAPSLFHYVGRPDLAAQAIRRVIRTRFSATSYPGDEDSGAMSSYYIWASLGLFPNAGQDLYFLNGPLFDHVSVRRPEEGRLEISRTGHGDYVQSVTLNGKPFTRSWLRHGEIKGDTVLEFVMGESPREWVTGEPPPSDNSPAGRPMQNFKPSLPES
jgi:predicted alpha-1,2-mannosidase